MTPLPPSIRGFGLFEQRGLASPYVLALTPRGSFNVSGEIDWSSNAFTVKLTGPPTASFAQQRLTAANALQRLPQEAIGALMDEVGQRAFSRLTFAPAKLQLMLTRVPKEHERERILNALCAVADPLASHREADRLATGIVRGWDERQRLYDLKELIRLHPKLKLTAAAVKAACRDKSELVRLEAGVAAGKDGFSTLAAIVTNSLCAPAIRSAALEACRAASPGEWQALPTTLAASGDRFCELAAIEAMATLPFSSALEALMMILQRTNDDDVLRRAVHELPRLPKAIPHVEPHLVACLAFAPPDLAGDIGYLLGEAGSLEALPALQAAQKKAKAGAAKKVLKEAYEKVKKRHGAASGLLSLAEDARGAVSKANP